MSYTHNKEAEYRDVAFQAREEVTEGQKEFYKLFGAAGFSVLAAAACGGGSGGSIGSGASVTPPSDDLLSVNNDYASILAPNAAGWKYLSAFHDDFVHMNYGTVGSMPVSVLQDLAQWHRDVAYSPAGPLNWEVSHAVVRAEFAKECYGALPQEVLYSFNTTDGMIKTITGIKWNKGETVLLTNNEHGGGLGPLHMVANRYGLNLIEVAVPTGVSKGPGTGGYAEDGELVDRFEAARAAVAAKGGKVRAIMFSSPPYTLGWRLQEKELCLWAASKGILSIIDGAHILGSVPIDLHDMGCDYFASTIAKWQSGPGQTGFAYIRVGKKGDSKSTTFQGRDISVGDWTNPNAMEPFFMNASGYRHFEGLRGYNGVWKMSDDLAGAMAGVGNANYPTLKIAYETMMVWRSIGREKIAKYNQSLAQYLRQKATSSDKMGPYSTGTDHRTPQGVVPTGKALETTFPRYLQTGLSAINPFSPGKDYNADLTPAESSAQSAAASAVSARLSSEFGITIATSAAKQQLRSNPAKSAQAVNVDGSPLDPALKNNAQALRLSTHLYTTVAEVDRCMEALNIILD